MLDLRLPVGIFFLIVGVVLSVYGAIHPVISHGVSINVDLVWGICLAIFGLLMAVFGWMAQRAGTTTSGTSEEKRRLEDQERSQ